MGSIFQHPLSSSRFSNLVRMACRHGVELPYLPRFLGVALLSLLRQPVIWTESFRYGSRIREQAIDLDPVFVIGHWRSGTTHLQNILSKDPQFAGVSLDQAALPLDFLSLGGFFNGPMSNALPKKRLMDNVAVATDSPWEEELALACTSPLSFYNVSFFPKGIGRIFRESILFDGGDAVLVEQWKQDYLAFLKKVQMTQPGKRFMLKNPANSARISVLLELFPDARFIHIHRNPYKVFASTLHLYLKAQEEWGFHRVNRTALIEHILETYLHLMNACLEQLEALPGNRLAEIAFHDLQQSPMETIRQAYTNLELDGFDEAAPHFSDYLDSVRDYKKNRLQLAAEEKARIASQWCGMFEKLGYEI
jgi:hypothetical protein